LPADNSSFGADFGVMDGASVLCIRSREPVTLIEYQILPQK
jgi:hypothetical protein